MLPFLRRRGGQLLIVHVQVVSRNMLRLLVWWLLLVLVRLMRLLLEVVLLLLQVVLLVVRRSSMSPLCQECWRDCTVSWRSSSVGLQLLLGSTKQGLSRKLWHKGHLGWQLLLRQMLLSGVAGVASHEGLEACFDAAGGSVRGRRLQRARHWKGRRPAYKQQQHERSSSKRWLKGIRYAMESLAMTGVCLPCHTLLLLRTLPKARSTRAFSLALSPFSPCAPQPPTPHLATLTLCEAAVRGLCPPSPTHRHRCRRWPCPPAPLPAQHLSPLAGRCLPC